jgi:hypothetical protein
MAEDHVYEVRVFESGLKRNVVKKELLRMGIFRKLFLVFLLSLFFRGNPRLARGQILKICVCDEHIWGSIPHASGKTPVLV